MNTNPLVSVIIPTYNYEHVIDAAINSVLESDFPREEIDLIVVDDGSTDDTAKKVKLYGDRLRYVAQENQGKAAATSMGIAQSRGKYIFNLDADDMFMPDKLSRVVEAFEQDSDIIHVAHPAIYWYADRDEREVENVPKQLLGKKILGKDTLSYFYCRGILFGGGSTFAARGDFLRRQQIPQDIDMQIDEYLVLITLNQGYSYFIDRPLSYWRIHGGNYSHSTANASISGLKATRVRKSIKAVLANVLAGDFSEEIKNFYLLKSHILDLTDKELTGTKSVVDILSLWRFVLSNFSVLSPNFMTMVRNYTILNRSLPSPMINALKSIKRQHLRRV